MEIERQWKAFGGHQLVVSHASASTKTTMQLSVYLPPQAHNERVPVVYYLSGLTCTWENVTTKGGFQRMAAELGLAVVCPDTSPRGEGVADDEAYDLGQGAGFYVDATQAPWAEHYRMYTYVTDELPAAVGAAFAIDTERCGIVGHSMGGHGALVIGLRNPDRYRSISALAPIMAPSLVQWGQKAFTAYLGADREAWAAYDASALVAEHAHQNAILIDQGDDDEFYESQLRTGLFVSAAEKARQPVHVRIQPGYDHSYYFVATFLDDHLRHHAARLK